MSARVVRCDWCGGFMKRIARAVCRMGRAWVWVCEGRVGHPPCGHEVELP